MRGQVSLLAPAVYCIFHDTQVMRDLLGGHPRLWFHSCPHLPESAGTVYCRLKSITSDFDKSG